LAAWLTFPILGLAAAACSAGDRSSHAVVSDSAGVQIIDNTEFAWPEGVEWRLAGEPALDIGVVEGEAAYQLFDVVGAQRLTDGRIVVANAGSFELRFYDANGSHTLSAGGEGGGPGEFRGIMGLAAVAGDSLFVFDWRNQRVSFFDARGTLSRTAQLEFLPAMGGFPMIVAPFDDGSLLVGVRTYERSIGISRDKIVYVRSDSEGHLIDTLAVLPGGEMHFMAQENRRILGDRPFGRYPQHAVYRDGFFYGSGDRYEIEYYGDDAQLRRSIRRAQANMEVTDADVEGYTRNQLENAGDERQRQINERLLADVTFPATFPAYRNFIVDAEGNLWVAVYGRPGDESPRWTVFDSNGQMLGEVSIPERFTVYQIGSDFVLGRWRDDLTVEHVLLFELLKE
jgi:hypothetical protein